MRFDTMTICPPLFRISCFHSILHIALVFKLLSCQSQETPMNVGLSKGVKEAACMWICQQFAATWSTVSVSIRFQLCPSHPFRSESLDNSLIFILCPHRCVQSSKKHSWSTSMHHFVSSAVLLFSSWLNCALLLIVASMARVLSYRFPGFDMDVARHAHGEDGRVMHSDGQD